MLLLSIFPTLR